MGLLSIVLLVIFALAAVLMILVIMLQDDQGEGIGGLFGGGVLPHLDPDRGTFLLDSPRCWEPSSSSGRLPWPG